MLRLNSFVLVLLLAAPMLRDCCFPAAPAPSACHKTAQSDDRTCAVNQQAINNGKSGPLWKSLPASTAPEFVAYFAFSETGNRPADRPSNHTHAIDICLRTGALLI